MEKIQIPFSFLYSHPCSCCGEVISGGRVFLSHNESSLCEDCSRFSKYFCRNLAYEALASNFAYPCKYWQKHCPAKLDWRLTQTHNANCKFRGCCSLFFNHPAFCLKGKRQFPNEKQRTGLMQIPTKVLNYLTCSICKSYLNCQPIYSRSDHDITCHRCVTINGKPPNSVRNIPYESIAQLYVYPCSFYRYGCDEILAFGKPAWKHEYECPFNLRNASPATSKAETESEPIVQEEIPPRPSVKPKTKGKGLVWTQTGPIWATLSPNTPLFAPPQGTREELREELREEVVKSFKKKHGKHRAPIDRDDIMARRNSESESVSTTMSTSQAGTLSVDNTETSEWKQASNFHYLDENKAWDSRISPNSRESNNTDVGVNQYEAEIAAHYPVMPAKQNALPRAPSTSRYDAEMASHFPGLYLTPRQNSFRATEEELFGHFPWLTRPTVRQPEAEIAGHFPIMLPRQWNNGADSLERRMSKENFQGNRMLINELKYKQDMIKRNHSMKEQTNAGYRQ